MRRGISVCFLFLLFGLQTRMLHGADIPLASMNHTLLADFLARSERLLKWEDKRVGTRFVEIYQISEGALACGDTLESCPRQRLFISIWVSDYYLESFISPPSLGWKDPKVVHWARDLIDFTVIEVQETVAGHHPGTADTRTRRIFLGESEAYLQ